MEPYWDVAIVFGFPAVIVALGLLYFAFQRYLKHKEWMAMIDKGIVPEDWGRSEFAAKPTGKSSSPVVVTLVGVAITLGLATIGIGPWLIGGLVPTAIGCGLLINEYLGESRKRKRE